MEDTQKENLLTHLTQMGYSLATQVSNSGTVLVRIGNRAEVDLLSMHHIGELFRRLDSRMFEHYLQLIIGYLANQENQCIDSQFAIDTIASVVPDAPIIKEVIEKTILPTQLESGAFTKYTAFLHGGDFFSTLWCVKILQNVGKEKYKESYDKAIKYISANCRDAHIKTSLKGFAYILLIKDGEHEITSHLREELHRFADESKPEIEDLLWQFYIFEDILEDPSDLEGRAIVEKRIYEYFDLEQEAKQIPKVFSIYLEKAPHQGIAYHLYARACMVGLLLFNDTERRLAAYTINRLIQSKGLDAVYQSLQKDVELKEYLQKYGGIHQAFSQYNEDLEQAWSRHLPFERSVFIMMPFKNSATYRLVTMGIREACENKGFKAIRVDDHDRQFRDTLWDNLVVNLLSCKYAVAVYVSDQIIDRLAGNEPKMFANPNVALEYGFFRSRGQQICLLKDKKSPIPSDLGGFLWNAFDIEDPKDDVVAAVEKFLENILKTEADQNLSNNP